ncbi:hypothetical protein DM02DRAFT_337061 [Periconia macrospinosa]|uniref:Uncharacterized protein n=1 Tax=Periconia macrospinosa TaxID=97972 RepID=A0A2V1DY21_9PLEO|nr:hypothetical protein DM02DRAFT_337061 [Periconia macrospinosa]
MRKKLAACRQGRKVMRKKLAAFFYQCSATPTFSYDVTKSDADQLGLTVFSRVIRNSHIASASSIHSTAYTRTQMELGKRFSSCCFTVI